MPDRRIGEQDEPDEFEPSMDDQLDDDLHDDLDDDPDAVEPPVRRVGDRFELTIGDDESAVIRHLLGELRALLTARKPGRDATELLTRLFPVAYPHDDEMEDEYQRLMRDELVQSKLRSFDVVEAALGSDEPIDEDQLVAVMQSVNSIRLVLGVMLDVTDDPDADEVDESEHDSPEYALYGYLSWLLEWCVRAVMSTAA